MIKYTFCSKQSEIERYEEQVKWCNSMMCTIEDKGLKYKLSHLQAGESMWISLYSYGDDLFACSFQCTGHKKGYFSLMIDRIKCYTPHYIHSAEFVFK